MLERDLARGADELAKFQLGQMPDGKTLKTFPAILNAPDRTQFPSQPFANRLQNSRARRLQGFSLGQEIRHSITGSETAFGLFALGDIPRNRKNQPQAFVRGRIPQQPTVCTVR